MWNWQKSMAQVRVSLYSWLPAGRDKSAGYLAHISCEEAIHYVPNLAFVIITLGKSVVFQLVCFLKDQTNVFIII